MRGIFRRETCCLSSRKKFRTQFGYYTVFKVPQPSYSTFLDQAFGRRGKE